MKYLLILGLAGLAGMEYLHHRWDSHVSGERVCVAPHAQMDEARDLLRQHLLGHR